MSYYSVLGLKKEPFSTSPDPEFLYRSSSHISALRRIEIAIRLKRGLSLLLGDVGTGKTTLARALIQNFREEPDFVFHMVLDPYYETRAQFISSLCRVLGLEYTYSEDPEAIERYFFREAAIKGKTVVLLIDEGQKLSPAGIELLRTLLNYETNDFKLLQLVIMAQLEFLEAAGRVRNFMDRVSFKYILNPLDEEETTRMIQYRLCQAGYSRQNRLFTDEAMVEIYQYTKGYPRRITTFCHQALEYLVMYDRQMVDGGLVRELIKQELKVLQAHQVLSPPPPRRESTGSRLPAGPVNG